MSARALQGGGPSSAATPRTPSVFHAQRRFAETPFGRVAYVDRGAGAVVLFFHGYPLNGYQWLGVIDRLEPHRRCIAPDFLGLGYSECPPGQDVSPSAQVDTILAFLDALGVERVDVIANNSGGTIAQLFAVRHPGRVRSLLFTNCDVHTNSPPAAFLPTVDAARDGTLADRFLRRSLEDRDFGRRRFGLFHTDPESLTDENIEVYLTPLISSPQRIAQFHAYTTSFLPNPLPTIEPLLRASIIPVRMVWGDDSSSFGVEWAYWLDTTFRQSHGVRFVPGGKLFFPEEHPDLVADEALAFWRSLEGSETSSNASVQPTATATAQT